MRQRTRANVSRHLYNVLLGNCKLSRKNRTWYDFVSVLYIYTLLFDVSHTGVNSFDIILFYLECDFIEALDALYAQVSQRHSRRFVFQKNTGRVIDDSKSAGKRNGFPSLYAFR